MKTILLSAMLLLASLALQAQSVSGSITTSDGASVKIEVPEGNVTELYKQFRDGKHQINFRFSDDGGLGTDAQGRAIVLFEILTTLKVNGKEVSKISRSDLPFFPGDMWMPVETFDFIHQLYKVAGGTPDAKLPRGNYEVIIEARPKGGVKGKIAPLSIVFF
jgi:hypothetical protein